MIEDKGLSHAAVVETAIAVIPGHALHLGNFLTPVVGEVLVGVKFGIVSQNWRVRICVGGLLPDGQFYVLGQPFFPFAGLFIGDVIVRKSLAALLPLGQELAGQLDSLGCGLGLQCLGQQV